VASLRRGVGGAPRELLESPQRLPSERPATGGEAHQKHPKKKTRQQRKAAARGISQSPWGGAGPSRGVLSEPASFVFLGVGACAKWRRDRAPPRAPAAEAAISRNLPERTQKNLKALRVISVTLFQGALATWVASPVGSASRAVVRRALATAGHPNRRRQGRLRS